MGNAHIHFVEGLAATFKKNVVNFKGGAIYADTIKNNYMYDNYCAFQFQNSIEFIENKASKASPVYNCYMETNHSYVFVDSLPQLMNKLFPLHQCTSGYVRVDDTMHLILVKSSNCVYLHWIVIEI